MNTKTNTILDTLNTDITLATDNLIAVIQGTGKLSSSLTILIQKINVQSYISIGLDSSVKIEDMNKTQCNNYKAELKKNGTLVLNEFMHNAISKVKTDDQTFAEWLKIEENKKVLNSPKKQIQRTFNKLYPVDSKNWIFTNITLKDNEGNQKWTGKNKLIIEAPTKRPPQTQNQITEAKIKAINEAKKLLKDNKIPVGQKDVDSMVVDTVTLTEAIIKFGSKMQLSETASILKAVFDHCPKTHEIVEDNILDKVQKEAIAAGRNIRINKGKNPTTAELLANDIELTILRENANKSTKAKVLKAVNA